MREKRTCGACCGVPQNVGRGTEGSRTAVPDKQCGRSEAQGLFHGVGDVEYGNLPYAGNTGDIVHEFIPSGRIEGCQRFVHEQQTRTAEQSAPYGHALFFPAGERGGHTSQQVSYAQQIDGIVEVEGVCAFAGAEASAEEQIFPHVEMRKKPSVLKDITGFASFRGQVHTLFRIEPDLAFADDMTVVRRQQAGYAVDQRAFAGTGGAEQRADGAFHKVEVHVQGKVPQAFVQLHGQHIVRHYSSCYA